MKIQNDSCKVHTSRLRHGAAVAQLVEAPCYKPAGRGLVWSRVSVE
jgi:hypothetical protein